MDSVYHTFMLVGNWKMYAPAQPDNFSNSLLSFLQELNSEARLSVVLCPPIHLLSALAPCATPPLLSLGAQDCSAFVDTDHTGDVSATMIKNLGADYVILGHSERRHSLHESSALIAQKAQAAVNNDLVPIVCIGETKEERESGRTLEIIDAQLAAIPPQVSVIAYEPVWAIGQQMTSLPLDIIGDVCTHILEQRPNSKLLYGGSVKAEFVEELTSQLPIQGFLVGGASRRLDDFCGIIKQLS